MAKQPLNLIHIECYNILRTSRDLSHHLQTSTIRKILILNTYTVNVCPGYSWYILCFPFADDSGWWGKGGVFTAISKRCHAVEEQYELAAKMKGMHMYEQSLFYWYWQSLTDFWWIPVFCFCVSDMNVGDCHLISFDDEGSSKDVENWVKTTHTSHLNRNIALK